MPIRLILIIFLVFSCDSVSLSGNMGKCFEETETKNIYKVAEKAYDSSIKSRLIRGKGKKNIVANARSKKYREVVCP